MSGKAMQHIQISLFVKCNGSKQGGFHPQKRGKVSCYSNEVGLPDVGALLV
jgi:hypothetical protein